MSGKHACVLAIKPGMSYTGKATKQLAGAGCLYVRLTRDVENPDSDHDDSTSVVDDGGGGISDNDVAKVKVETPPTCHSTPLRVHCLEEETSNSQAHRGSPDSDLTQPSTSAIGAQQVHRSALIIHQLLSNATTTEAKNHNNIIYK